MTCDFFGHRDCPDAVKPRLLDAIRKQIEGGGTAKNVGRAERIGIPVVNLSDGADG